MTRGADAVREDLKLLQCLAPERRNVTAKPVKPKLVRLGRSRSSQQREKSITQKIIEPRPTDGTIGNLFIPLSAQSGEPVNPTDRHRRDIAVQLRQIGSERT